MGPEPVSDEARTLARFEHPNVVRVRDCFEANNTAYIVMDYEDGEPLDELLRRHGTLTEAQLKRVLLPVADGLRQVHAAGFLHRDVKPANIFVRRSDESPVLLDFGSARQALGRRSRSVTAIASAGYSPPEQYESGGEHGPWTDIYALSALSYRAITGETPMEATRRQSELLRTGTDPLPRLAEVGREGYSPISLEAVDWGLRLIETERPQSLDEWLAALEGATTRRQSGDSEQRQARQPASPPTSYQTGNRKANRGRSGAAWLAVGLGSLLAIGLVWFATQQDAGQPFTVLVEPWLRISPATPPSGDAGQPFTVLVEPADARVRILNVGLPYRAGMELPTGSYGVEASASGYVTKTETVAHGSAPTLHRMSLSPLAQPFTVLVEPADARVRILNIRSPYRAGMELAAGSYEIEASAKGYAMKTETVAHSAAPTVHRMALSRIGFTLPESVSPTANPPSLQALAKQGDADAQLELGNRYYNGEGVAEDAGQAAQWYRKAADQGDATAQRILGYLYQAGDGVARDAREAARWYHKAAEQGDADAQFRLGWLHAAAADGLMLRYRVPFTAAEKGWLIEAAANPLIAATAEDDAWFQLGPRNAREAAEWFRRAAEQGHAEAQYSLGSLYNRWGTTKHAGEDAYWTRKAAEGGHAVAQFLLGKMYSKGDGVPQNAREAARWSRKAAEQGHAEAQRNLGVLYAKGIGVPQDTVQAYAWVSLAAAQRQWLMALGNQRERFAPFVTRGATRILADLQRDMSPPQIAEAQKLSRELVEGVSEDAHDDGQEAHALARMVAPALQRRKWYRRAHQGDADAQFQLGWWYEFGVGVAKDTGEAAQWYRKAAEQGHARAQYGLGLLYRHGDGVTYDAREAAHWYRKAAERGDPGGQFALGALYVKGEGVAKDHGEAALWLRKALDAGELDALSLLNALSGSLGSSGLLGSTPDVRLLSLRVSAEKGDVEAQLKLADSYYEGDDDYVGVSKDLRKAAQWYRKAAEQGNASAQFNLGLMYGNGEGVPQDAPEAVRWYRKAAEQRVPAAQFNLGVRYQTGDGVPKDAREAVQWYRKAAEQGVVDAQFNLGVMYGNGEGVPKDAVQAYAWFNLSAAQGDEHAARARTALQRYMTAVQIAQAQELSRELVD